MISDSKILKGSINPHLSGLTVSPTLGINEQCRDMAAKGKMVFNLGLGQSPFPVPEFVVEALRHYAPQKMYLPVTGLPALREAIAEFHSKKDSVAFDPGCIMIGPGSKELLFLLQLVFEGDVFIASPCWVSYVPQAKILNKKIHIIHTSFDTNWLLTSELLGDALKKQRKQPQKPALLIINYPGNPQSTTYHENELHQIAEIARKNGLIILSDEIYGQLNHTGNHISIARFYPEGAIVSSGLSKWCGAGGWRLGTFSFPVQLKWIMDAMTIVASETYTSVSAPIQYAAVSAFRGGYEMEQYLWHARRILSGLGKICIGILLQAGFRAHRPEGGFYLFPVFQTGDELLEKKGIKNSMDFCKKLLDDTDVAVLPGTAFNRPSDEISFRIAYVDFDGAKALSASYTTLLNEPLPDGFFSNWCGRIIESVNRIANWTGN